MPRKRIPVELGDAEWLREKYMTMTAGEIAAEIGTSPSSVDRALRRHRIPRRGGRRASVAIGDRFGALTVISDGPRGERGRRFYVVLCARCQREAIMGAATLKKAKSCRHCVTVRHGHARVGEQSPTYRSWCSMIKRCTNPKDTAWERYGGAGVAICERWQGRGGFVNFLADMGERPEGMTLDRIDSAGDYEPSNCRWATVVEQNRNRRPWGSCRPKRMCPCGCGYEISA